jgi:hypothetical protein
LKKRGILILEEYKPKQIEYLTGGPSDSQKLFSAEMMRGDFDQLSWMKLESLETEIHRGKGYTGLSSFLSGVGMKNN